MPVKIGPYEVRTVITSRFGLDGGAMFGSIPRGVWTKEITPDEDHRIPMVARTLVIQGEGMTILVDTGVGHRFSDVMKAHLNLDAEVQIGAELRKAGIEPEQVTHLFLTHLHFDHSGGLFRGSIEKPEPNFPHAKILIQRENYERASNPGPKERASYRALELEPLSKSDLVLLDGEAEPLPGIRVRVTHGHTRGHQSVEVFSKNDFLLYPGDLAPTISHLRLAFSMGFDMHAEDLVQDKERLLDLCLQRDGILVFDHDPRVPACRLGRTEKGFHAKKSYDF
ncbi:MAG: MBL fold metallo-hydrolase [Candidatus Eisenbacteria bacterium]|uniref:MBL fold metallo-hydrolase n=1 Tax=Eiseniibacteriota bacterium TaxID=2212470 RepID=A0A948W5K7_UNCEI|nr:MBL fold metallo-hydrolase [Candidatus Eisenbacteria bacterium]MBU1947964.1 MBL fold metallo-hydrolase [Candidatus Eisenbacteria bacterium]MBU2693412.1 MBL fold metallo-hydrolase [Candidatus Eisenbacteria bacterium]